MATPSQDKLPDTSSQPVLNTALPIIYTTEQLIKLAQPDSSPNQTRQYTLDRLAAAHNHYVHGLVAQIQDRMLAMVSKELQHRHIQHKEGKQPGKLLSDWFTVYCDRVSYVGMGDRYLNIFNNYDPETNLVSRTIHKEAGLDMNPMSEAIEILRSFGYKIEDVTNPLKGQRLIVKVYFPEDLKNTLLNREYGWIEVGRGQSR